MARQTRKTHFTQALPLRCANAYVCCVCCACCALLRVATRAVMPACVSAMIVQCCYCALYEPSLCVFIFPVSRASLLCAPFSCTRGRVRKRTYLFDVFCRVLTVHRRLLRLFFPFSSFHSSHAQRASRRTQQRHARKARARRNNSHY
jgi:hypothetical protein